MKRTVSHEISQHYSGEHQMAALALWCGGGGQLAGQHMGVRFTVMRLNGKLGGSGSNTLGGLQRGLACAIRAPV